ncbi:MAG: alpha/beta hydrolase [Cyanobacteria bacterium]|nr:alpha/beta hydrolase [Cyanobacteriota bacterium]
MKPHILLFASLGGVALLAQSRGPLDLANAAVPPGAQRLSYGVEPLQFGELRVPNTPGPHPVAIVIHGGCWMAKLGTMDPRAVAIDNMRPLANALTDAGIATWNIEYRRLGDPGGGWPGSFRDVAAAADFLRTIAANRRLDLNRVATIGHSAGGHFAIWLAARKRIPKGSELFSSNPLAIAGVVDLDGPGDLRATLPLQQPVCGGPVVTDLIGGSPEQQPDRYRAASPIELLPLGTRQVVLAGRMFGPQTPAYEAAVRKAGDSIEVSVSDAGHFVFIDPASDMWPTVLKSVRAVLSMQ